MEKTLPMSVCGPIRRQYPQRIFPVDGLGYPEFSGSLQPQGNKSYNFGDQGILRQIYIGKEDSLRSSGISVHQETGPLALKGPNKDSRTRNTVCQITFLVVYVGTSLSIYLPNTY